MQRIQYEEKIEDLKNQQSKQQNESED